MSQNQKLSAEEFAASLPGYLPDPADRNALVMALGMMTATVIGTLVPAAQRARYVEAFCTVMRDSVEMGESN